MPVEPHLVTFTVYQDDNETVQKDAKVIIRNTTRKTTHPNTTKTNANGVVMVDLANFSGSTPYATGDKILLISTYGNQSAAVMYTVAGQSKSQDLYLTSWPYNDQDTARLMHILTAEPAGTVAYCKVWSYDDGELLAHIETPANNSQSILFGYLGKQAARAVLEREANTLVVTATWK